MNMSVNDEDDHQELDTLETLSLTDFPLREDDHSDSVDHRHHNSPSPTTEDLFEFCSGTIISGGLSEPHRMSHAEDMFYGGKLIPINDQNHHEQPPKPPNQSNQSRTDSHIDRRRCESMHELKSSNNKGSLGKLMRNSYSLDYKKLNRNSRESELHRNNLSCKTSSSRWSDLVFGPLKVPPEMDLQDIRNRQIVNTSKSLFPAVEPSDRVAVRGVGFRRKMSWGVLGILSCRSSGSVAVAMPLGYEKLSLKN